MAARLSPVYSASFFAAFFFFFLESVLMGRASSPRISSSSILCSLVTLPKSTAGGAASLVMPDFAIAVHRLATLNTQGRAGASPMVT